MKFYFQFDEQGRVASYSEAPIVTDVFKQCATEVDDVTYSLMQQNYDLFIQDGVLLCVKPDRLIKSEQAQILQDLKEKVRDGIADQADINQILLHLLN